MALKSVNSVARHYIICWKVGFSFNESFENMSSAVSDAEDAVTVIGDNSSTQVAEVEGVSENSRWLQRFRINIQVV